MQRNSYCERSVLTRSLILLLLFTACGNNKDNNYNYNNIICKLQLVFDLLTIKENHPCLQIAFHTSRGM